MAIYDRGHIFPSG